MVDAACSAQVAGQAGDAVWNEPSDGANGVDADHHAPGRAGNNPAARPKSRSSLMKAPGRLGNRAGIGAHEGDLAVSVQLNPEHARPRLAGEAVTQCAEVTDGRSDRAP